MGEVAGLVGMKNLFKTPSPPEATPPATASSPAVQQAVAEAAQRRSRARGYRSTIIGGLGGGSAAPAADPNALKQRLELAMPVAMPLRQPGSDTIRHNWRSGSVAMEGADLRTCPAIDSFVWMTTIIRANSMASCLPNDRVPVPNQITYGFPYVRSGRSQILWKRAHIKVQYAR